MQIILNYNIYSGQSAVAFLFQIIVRNISNSWINLQTYFSVLRFLGYSLFGLQSPPWFPKYRCAAEHQGALQSRQQGDMHRYEWHRSHRVAALSPEHPHSPGRSTFSPGLRRCSPEHIPAGLEHPQPAMELLERTPRLWPGKEPVPVCRALDGYWVLCL